MDINSAEKNLAKLHAYVKELADTKPKMYQKSRERLKDLSETCREVVTLIADILQDEALAYDEVEFGGRSNIESALDSMQNQIAQIRSFAGCVEPHAPQNFTKSSSAHISHQQITTVSVSANAKKHVLRNYKDVLHKVSMIDFKYDAVDRCAKLLWYWFDTRFVKTVHGSGFKYSMKRFPTWIRDIVVLYGKAVRDGEYLRFDTQFRWWVNSIIADSSTQNRYAVPYEVFAFEKDMQPDDMSLEAVVLWDILVDSGLSELCTSITDDMYLQGDSVYNLCGEFNPGILDQYMNYVDHPEILDTLGWEVRNHA